MQFEGFLENLIMQYFIVDVRHTLPTSTLHSALFGVFTVRDALSGGRHKQNVWWKRRETNQVLLFLIILL